MDPASAPPPRTGTGPLDLILVQRALRAEPPAVEELLARLSCVLRFVYRLNRSLGYHLPADALEDVVQQVYAALWPRLGDFAGEAALESWAFGFCRNCLRAEARKRAAVRRLQPRSSDTPETAEALAAAGSGEPAVFRTEGLDALREELQRLKPVEREAVELRHLEGWSFEEIARRQGLPPSTVKDRCYRAMLKMKDRLQRRHVIV